MKADEPTTIEHVLDHFDHVKKLVGPEFLGVGSDIDLFGYDAVPAKELAALYGAATLVAYASRYEGFGLPPVEAMACGAAVVSTPVPAVAEVVGAGAAMFTPGDVDGLADTLRELLADEERRFELAERGKRAVAQLTWDRTAR